MKNYTIRLFTVTLLLSLFVWTSCGSDDPVSGMDEDPPAIPTFEDAEPDLSYFMDNNPKLQTTNNFYDGKSYALGLMTFSQFGQIYSSFFSSADTEEAEFDNGVWTWTYSYAYEGESISIVLTAQELTDSIRWEMNWSYDDGQGNSFEDYTMIEGTMANDGSYGDWTFNSLNPDTNTEEPLMTSEWTRSGDDQFELETRLYGDSGQEGEEFYTFVQDGTSFDMTYTYGTENIYIHWDTSTETGYYQIGNDSGNRYCWDSQFQDVSCGV
ncbi:hypothetical protein [Gracilimonas amylolytica]|jgi:hypothetical protein|uniref:hypothetical protein n=1 Tax=Gracilimonas amylolytica TaxID=1749045 RepID=UPI000CD930BD|nr:hypothetical protein [Gracilimonas amylolytica]